MTVLQIIKGLIGEEDVNFGDSDTTFTRQTHTGGTTTIHYIDSKSLPANTLGGVVDTHLHVQNTDTGTTATTFTIRTGGNGVILSSAGLEATRTYTFPLTSQPLAGVSDLVSTATSYGASMIGIEDSAGNFSSTNVEDALGELAVDVATQQVDVATQLEFRGYAVGFMPAYSTTTAITISAGMFEHRGTTTQNVYTETQITFTLGSGGSNAASDNLGANELHYLYIDDSAVVIAGTTKLTASEFRNDTTAPSWSSTKCGWYKGLDRCIGVVRTDGSSHIIGFRITGSNYYAFNTAGSTIIYNTLAPVIDTALDLSAWLPVFSTMCTMVIKPHVADVQYHFRPSGGASYFTSCVAILVDGYQTIDVHTNDSQIADWIASASDPYSYSLVTVLYLKGFYMNPL